MTNKELRKLSRAELLEMLIEQGRENEQLKEELEKTRAALADRSIKIEKSGSIAEAALALSGIFEDAQKAAELYLDSIKEQHGGKAEEKEPQPSKPDEDAKDEAKPVSKMKAKRGKKHEKQ